jgi:hypothetical protein
LFDPIQSLIDSSQINDHNAEVVTRFLLCYYQEMNDVERRFPWNDSLSSEENSVNLSEVIAAKLLVHNKFWEPTDDEFWKPCSSSSEEEFNVRDIEAIKVRIDHRNHFLAEVSYPKTKKGPTRLDTVYLIENREINGVSRLFIVNKFS